MLTSRDIAKMAGVSQATVSRVLQGKDNVREETRRKVLSVVESTGYVANEQARAMRTRKTGTVGVVTGRITNPFYPELLSGLGDAITATGMRMALWASDSPSGAAAAVEAIRGRLVDGLIFTTATYDSPALKIAIDIELPFVLVNRSLRDIRCDQVTSDNVQGGRLVANHFLEADRSDVAVIGGNEDISTGRERRWGFVAEFKSKGLEIPPGRQLECDFLHDAARDVALDLFSSGSPPSGVFCVNDLVAFGVIDALHRLGVAIPEEAWIVGYDDIAMAGWDVFNLTTVRQPIDYMTEVAVGMMVMRINGTDAPFEHRRFAPDLITRGSAL